MLSKKIKVFVIADTYSWLFFSDDYSKFLKVVGTFLDAIERAPSDKLFVFKRVEMTRLEYETELKNFLRRYSNSVKEDRKIEEIIAEQNRKSLKKSQFKLIKNGEVLK